MQGGLEELLKVESFEMTWRLMGNGVGCGMLFFLVASGIVLFSKGFHETGCIVCLIIVTRIKSTNHSVMSCHALRLPLWLISSLISSLTRS